MINRRTFTRALQGLVLLPGAPAVAQAIKPPGKIGYIHQVTVDPQHAGYRILRSAWRQLGYVEGETVLPRAGEDNPARLQAVTDELLAAGVGVLVTVGADALRVAARTTGTVPIVAIDLETDPVESGLIKSYARPGGNVKGQGLFLDLPALATKWIEMVRETVPALERVAFHWHPSTGRSQLDIALGAARIMGLEAVVLETQISDDFVAKLAPLAKGKRTAVVQLTMPGFQPVASRFAAAAIAHKLVSITYLRAIAAHGLLMSYGPNQETYFPRAIEIADKILRGDKAADTPIERPTKFEVVLNMTTAKPLGLIFPPTILIRADEVLE